MNCCFCFSEYPGQVGLNFGFDVFPTFTNLLQSSVFRFHFPLLPDFPNIPSHNPPNAFMIILFFHPRMLLLITSLLGSDTPGRPLYKTHLLSSINEIAHEKCGRLPVMWYNVGGWFQPHAARVTCSVWDVEPNIRMHRKSSAVCTIGRYTGILIIFLWVFKLGWIFALFSRVRQSRLNKSMN